jgi:hypothetical protein
VPLYLWLSKWRKSEPIESVARGRIMNGLNMDSHYDKARNGDALSGFQILHRMLIS